MEQWDTKEKIAAARERMEESHHDWRRPAAYGIGVYREGTTEFTRVNQNGNYLPAVILARVSGHTRGTSSHPMSVGQLEAAVQELSPAEAYTELDHPNLHHWRQVLADVRENGGQIVAVFVGGLSDPPADEHDAALRAALR